MINHGVHRVHRARQKEKHRRDNFVFLLFSVPSVSSVVKTFALNRWSAAIELLIHGVSLRGHWPGRIGLERAHDHLHLCV
jgi:hypothetical protein